MAEKKIIKNRKGLLASEGLPIFIVFICLIASFMIVAPKTFLSIYIYMSFLSTVAPPLILGLGLTFVIAAGEIDLSFPSVVAFGGFVFANLYKFHNFTVLAVAMAILAGVLVGFINGLIITKIGIPSIIATLATGFFWAGITVVLSKGLSYDLSKMDGTPLYDFFVYRINGIFPIQFLWVLGLAVIMWFILNKHVFGEHILFIGDNVEVAKVVSINVDLEKIKLFIMMGAFGAMAGVLICIENTSFWATQGQGYLLVVMAAVFIGGTSIFGGQGTIIGTFFGSFIVGSLEAGVIAAGLQGFYTRVIVGLVLLTAISFHIFMENPNKTRLLGIFRFNKV